MRAVVRVHASDEIAPAMAQAHIQCGDKTLVGTENRAESGILAPQTAQQIRRPIGRPIVYSDYFEIAIGLTQKAANGSLQGRCRVVHWEKNGDERNMGGHGRLLDS